MATEDALGLPPNAFSRVDEADDALFYSQPRLVTHIDDGAIAALTEFYRAALPAGGVLLDLMSSWVSHLPPEVAYGAVIGHGMNAAELEANPRLSRRIVQDLNRDPALPLEDASVDAAMICVGFQYLQAPVAVLRDLKRVLRPDGPILISFSNRCFPTKAVAVWRAVDEHGHVILIERCLRAAGFADVEVHQLADGRTCDPMIVVTGC